MSFIMRHLSVEQMNKRISFHMALAWMCVCAHATFAGPLVSNADAEPISRCDIDIFCPTVATYYDELWHSIIGHVQFKLSSDEYDRAFSKYMRTASLLYSQQWESWKQRNPDKVIRITNDDHAFANFVRNMDYYSQVNVESSRTDTSGHPVRLGANAFAYLSHEEFQQEKHLSEQAAITARQPKPHVKFLSPVPVRRGNDTINETETETHARGGLAVGATSKDWRTSSGIVGPVQNQGLCGSCWAFSSSEAIRSCNAVTHGQTTLDQLSAEQLLDCSQAEGNIYGCAQGYLWDGYVYVLNNGGINTNTNYPYTAGATGMNSSCIASLTTNHVATMLQHYYFYQGSGGYMTTQLNVQPITANVAGGSRYFQGYVSGIMTNTTACGTTVDHSVSIVGYGTSSGTPYWIIRNQWATTWGESGDARILRDTTNSGLIGMCAIMSFATYPTC